MSKLKFAMMFTTTNSGYRSTFVKRAAFASLTLLLSFIAVVGVLRVCTGQEQAPERKKKQIINFRDPKREYKTIKLGRWSIDVEQQLLDEAPEIAAFAAKRFRENVDQVFRLIPKDSQPKLKQLKFFILYGPKARGGGHDNGLEYFAPNSPKNRANLDERWESCIVVHCAENYAKLSNLWALKSVMHEFGHAYHLENWIGKQPHIMEAWQNAVDAKLYVDVVDETGKVIPEAYAHTNHLEYFAELSAMYFAKCNYAPFDRAALKKYDPMGYELIRKMWGLQKDDPPPPVTREPKK